MNGLGNGLVQFDNTSEGVDGLDFLQNLSFTNFKPSVAAILGDERADAQSRHAARPGFTLRVTSGTPPDVITQNVPFPLARGCSGSTRRLAMSRASAFSSSTARRSSSASRRKPTPASSRWPSPFPRSTTSSPATRLPWSGCRGRGHQHPKTISIPPARHRSPRQEPHARAERSL